MAALGDDYTLDAGSDRTVITTQETVYRFDVFIDARGQKPLKTNDLPFPMLRGQLEETGDEIPDIGEDYTLKAPDTVRGRIAFGAIPWLMHDRPFVQGLAECAEIAEAMAKAAENRPQVYGVGCRTWRTDRASMPCNARLFEEHFRVFRQRDEAFRRFIRGENFAAFNVVYPAVQAKRVITQAHRDGRVGLDVAELRKDVFLHHRIHFIDRLIPAFLLYHGFCRVGIAQPVRYSRHRLEVRVIGNRLHRAAVGVAADHDVGHAQRHYRVLDSCRDATAPARTVEQCCQHYE